MLHVIPIVGIGGQGKTTLAQLIYNDPQVEKYFELRLWVCVSEVFDIKLITEKILKSATNAETPNVEMEQLQGQLRREVADKTYLLVLDDVWNENREEWLKLRALLKIGRKGSKILVTTRSREVAKIMATVSVCELQGLSEEKSWNLFQKMAFEPGQTQQKLHLMEVGKEIVKKCANVPLAIRTVGSLLYGKDDSKWLSFKNRSLANLSDSENGVIDILKLSYQHLQSPLKNCFAYCSLFPKDYEFDKEILINLWMAEGFIVPKNHEGQSLEELAECYFLILMQRCFFQDIKRDEWGNISSCKMHDLMHDLAQQVAGINCKVIAKFEESSSNKGIHHLSFAYRLTSVWKTPSWMLNLKRLRTFLLPEQMRDGSPFSKMICQEILSTFGCLRVLDLHNLGVRNLPSSIGASLDVSGSNHDEALLEGLKPYSNLKQLEIHFYRGQKLPSWAMMGNLCINLPNLVKIDLLRCNWCQQVPSFGQLPSLKSLSLIYLKSVEYMEMDCSVYDLPSLKEPPSTEIPFFPSLQELTLEGMHNLKGWWKEAIVNNDTQDAANIPMKQQRLLSMSFPNVSKLFIQGCLKLISLPLCPNVEELELVHAFETMSVSKMAAASSSNSSSKLKSLTISNVEDLKCLSRECLHQLSSLDVRSGELVNTEEIGKEVFKSISSSLRSLTFSHCDRLRFFGQGLEHLTAIKSLELTIVNSLIYRQMNSCHGKT
ncbi:putative disease resistance protein RGA3 isoform X2 [Spinacia oleracea]|uniref:Disease resistance protein RGA3 isoform X2 n=1 Tax=Spinacia oleracea TaxID=3562 RepID=A0A9R0INT1_SPIOL|nr:putative disease resistance protein RGA3 isoform X2 [Spinacia oleracea]